MDALHAQWIGSAHFMVDTYEEAHDKRQDGTRLLEGVRMFVHYAELDPMTLSALLTRVDLIEARSVKNAC